MKIQQPNNNKTEVYSISGFRDTLASPVFYPVIVVSMLLGIVSIFGFVQNPMKLKSIVNVVHQKVAASNVGYNSIENKLYTQSPQIESSDISITNKSNTTLELISNLDEKNIQKMSIEDHFERVAFNYDLTSENFWTDLDSSIIETATEELERKEKESVTIGAPLVIDDQEKHPSKLNKDDDSLYALIKAKQS